MGNIRWVKRAITIEDPQRENEIELVDKNGMPAILYPVWKVIKNFNTIVFTGGTGEQERS